MSKQLAHFKEVHPILPVLDIEAAIQFYTERLGFRLAFRDPSGPDNYVGVRRDGVELHFQYQREVDMPPRGSIMIRFLVDDPDALFAEYQSSGEFDKPTSVEDKPWGTREFALMDPNGHGLTFYRDLPRSE
ncbi:MAG: VOC family protein [Planctomycetes bacterium]|nr:VOC family protein [Planctomycetota bacterium]MCB9909715.1 VOC family protein [Planctomycetota bacterium]MCB9911795.1 VOC family protein [Planctomycetota bacterium]HPF13977.1 VOC family protein [Planctomycetota bacterium]